MPRKGRALELLIARLEAVASGGQAQIHSPEYFTETDSETQREVDVTVRTKAGSANVLVMFECRDRAGNQDVRWMDEIVGKRSAIGADVAVAVVGTGGFTEGARKAAAARRIQLRTVEDITVEDVVIWCQMSHLTVELLEVRNHDFEVLTWANTPPLAHAIVSPFVKDAELPLDEPTFSLWDARNKPMPKHPMWLTAKQLHDFATNVYLRDRGLPRFSEWQPVSIALSTPENPAVAVMTQDGDLFPLAGLKVKCELRVTTKEAPLTHKSVTDDRGVVTQVVEAVTDDGSHDWVVAFIRSEDGLAVMVHRTGPSTPDA